MGKSWHFIVSSAPILDESGHLRGAVVSFDDVTELEEANVALNMVKELERSQTQIMNQNAELDHTNQSLVVEIAERKKVESEREVLNRRLQGASRQIGKAEVAASILHNVGNVLNSVNVSSRPDSQDPAADPCRQIWPYRTNGPRSHERPECISVPR